MMLSKSKAAFLLSCQILFDNFPNMYFWTFTFVNVYPDWWYPYIWHKFVRELGNHLNHYFCGVRVLEPHMFHGLHYHMLINRRIPIDQMRKIAIKYGMGRIGVDKCDFGAAIYLSKYLAKGSDKLFGAKRWHTVGAFSGVRVQDIEVDNAYMRCRRKYLRGAKIVIGQEHLLEGAFHLHGEKGFAKCWELLCEGKQLSACLLVSPHVELTPKGGLRYLKRSQLTPFFRRKTIPVCCVRTN